MRTGTTTRGPQDPLASAVRALELGDWPRAADSGNCSRIGGPEREDAEVAVLIRVTAAAMSAQAHGNVLAADRQYSSAAQILPTQLTRTLPDDTCQALMRTTQRAEREFGPLLRRVAAVIGREQVLLSDLRQRLTWADRPRDHLIEACIQFQMEVHYCAYSWTIDPPGSSLLPDVAFTRSDLLWRASCLRQFAFPQKGDVSESVWKDIHAPRGLWLAALIRLAGRPLAPWPTTGPRALIEVRRGRLCAWQHARRFQRDLHYD